MKPMTNILLAFTIDLARNLPDENIQQVTAAPQSADVARRGKKTPRQRSQASVVATQAYSNARGRVKRARDIFDQ
jgi:glucose-6-phosphate-specific signal transduction histidine kinase